MYMCISGVSSKGANPLKDTELEGCNYGEQKSSPRKMFQERKKSIKSKNVQDKKKKDENPRRAVYGCDEGLQISPCR